MSVRLRMVVTCTFEYDADPADYAHKGEPLPNPEQMARLDVESYEDDPGLLLMNDDATWVMKCEVVDGA